MSVPERGRWRQGILTALDQKILLVFALGQGALRAFDYVTGHGGTGIEYALINAAFPQMLIGAGFAAGLVAIVGGIILRWHAGVFVGHAWLCLGYTVLGFGMVISIAKSADVDFPIRGPGILLGAALLHGMWALRTGPVPLGAEVSTHVLESISEPDHSPGGPQ